MMHKIILELFKNCKGHGLLNSKLMDYAFDFQFYVEYVMVH